MDAESRKWVDRWLAFKDPISFGFGAALLIFEGVKAWTGRPIDQELVIAATGFCGLSVFTPSRKGER